MEPIIFSIIIFITVLIGMFFIAKSLKTGYSTTDGVGWTSRQKNPVLFWLGISLLSIFVGFLLVVLIFVWLNYLTV